MILLPEHEEALQAVRAYAISARVASGQLTPSRLPDDTLSWLGMELEITICISGYGIPIGNACPTWQSSSTHATVETALERALSYAPAQFAECNARAANRLGDILPEYDPDGTRKRLRPAKPKGTITAAQLSDLLGGIDL